MKNINCPPRSRLFNTTDNFKLDYGVRPKDRDEEVNVTRRSSCKTAPAKDNPFFPFTNFYYGSRMNIYERQAEHRRGAVLRGGGLTQASLRVGRHVSSGRVAAGPRRRGSTFHSGNRLFPQILG